MLASAIEANVRWSMHQLLEPPEGQNGLKMGVKLVGAVYDITTGQVRFLA
jgi:carbonic anhydrase